jgi:integrase
VSSRAPKGKRCGCRDDSGRQLGTACPKLRQRHHGTYEAAMRIDTSSGRRKLHRSGFGTAADRDAFEDQVRELVRLAGDDAAVRARIGDLIFSSTRRGGALPDAGDVRRRVGLGIDPAGTGETFGQAWATWLPGKKRLRLSSRRRLAQLGEHWLLPVLRDVLVERLSAAHCAMVFDRIEDINAEIRAAAAEGRPPVLDGDVRSRPKVIGIASQHRVYAALREILNYLWKQRHVITFNPVYAVELEAEETPEGQRWTAAQAARFLAVTEADPLGLMFRLVVLRGARRAEAVGFRWSAADLDAGYVAVDRPVLQLGGEVIEGRAKSKAGERRIWLDAGSVTRLRAHRKAQLAARLRASTAWLDNDLIFCRADGSPWPPDYVSRRFKALAAEAGVPVIKLHEGRHSAASLARDAGVDPKIRREQLGHATQAMTDHYTHVLADAHLEAAEAVARLVREAGA